MFKTIRQQIRPNTSVEFYSPDQSPNLAEAMFKHQYKTYIQTKKQLKVTKDLSEDGLTQTVTIFWESREAAKEYANDPIIQDMIKDSENYRNAHGIELKIISREEVEQ